MHGQRPDVGPLDVRLDVVGVAGQLYDLLDLNSRMAAHVLPQQAGQAEAGGLDEQEEWDPLVVADPALLSLHLRHPVHQLVHQHRISVLGPAVVLGVLKQVCF